MNNLKTSLVALTCIITSNVCSFAGNAASAQSGDFQVKTGQGEEFSVKHNLFGKKSFSAQDRLGDKIEHRQGLLGDSKSSVQLLGNGYETKKGILGSKSYKASTMLGDKVETKRSWFGLGRRKTTVDLSGTAGMVSHFLNGKKASDDLLPGTKLDNSATGLGSDLNSNSNTNLNSDSNSQSNQAIESAFPAK
jgi:hypothetical protein